MVPKSTKPILLVSGITAVLITGFFLIIAIIDPQRRELLMGLAGASFATGLIFIITSVITYILDRTKESTSDEEKTETIPQGHVGVVFDKGRLIQITEEASVKYKPGKEVLVKHIDLRQRFFEMTHVVQSRDKLPIELKAVISWQVVNIPRFIEKSDNPMAGPVAITIQSILVLHFGQVRFGELMHFLDSIAKDLVNQMPPYTYPYGIQIESVRFTQISLKINDDVQKQSERLRALNLAVADINGRTLEHIEKMEGNKSSDLGINLNMGKQSE